MSVLSQGSGSESFDVGLTRAIRRLQAATLLPQVEKLEGPLERLIKMMGFTEQDLPHCLLPKEKPRATGEQMRN
jgi:hypothetical protein